MEVTVFENAKAAVFADGAADHEALQGVRVLQHLTRQELESPVEVSLFSFETADLQLLEYVLSFRVPVVTVQGERPEIEPDGYEVIRFERGRVYVLLDNFLSWFDHDAEVQRARATLNPPLSPFGIMFTHGTHVSPAEERCAPKMYVSEKLTNTPRNYVYVCPGVYVRADAFGTKLYSQVRDIALGRLESSFPEVPDRHRI